MAGYGGYGGNPGSPSEAGMFADGRAWLAALERLGVPGHAAVLYGESLGSGVVVELAVGTAVAGVVLEAPYTSIADLRSEEHTSEIQSLMRISYAVFCLKKKKNNI